jgi:hypothetical protein
MPQKTSFQKVVLFTCLLICGLAFYGFPQAKNWSVSDLKGSQKFSVFADSLVVLDSNLFAVSIKKETILFKENPFQPFFRSKTLQFEPIDFQWIWQKSDKESHIALLKNPLQPVYKNVIQICFWNGKRLIQTNGKWTFRPGEPEELMADSIRKGKNKLFLFVSQGLVTVDSGFSTRFYPVQGNQIQMNPFETYFLTDSSWHPFSAKNIPIQQKPGFWWNDSIYVDSTFKNGSILGNWTSKFPKIDSAFFISTQFLGIKSKKQYFILSHSGKRVNIGFPLGFQMVSDTLLAVKTKKNWIFIGPSCVKNKVNKTISEIGFESEGLILAKAGKRFGFVDASGFIRVACRYDSLMPYKNGKAAARLGSFWGFLDKAEKLVVQPNFDQVCSFSNPLIPAKKQGKWGLIDGEGLVNLPFEFDSISNFYSRQFLLKKNGWTGMADERGQIVFQTRFFSIIEPSPGYILISREGKYGLNTTVGKSVLELKFQKIEVHTTFNRLVYY